MCLFKIVYLFAYWLISRLKRKTEQEALYAGEEDYFVYRVSVWMCSISMAVSIGSLMLLPFSVIGVELLQLYENNYWLQWLSYSLIGSLWNYVFILSNLSLFVLLPFSYFFIESQGFSNASARNGITQRVYETLAICALFIVVVLCLAEIVLTIMKYPVSFLSITSVNLPLIYSCVSLSGALLLLISTPYGFGKMFSFVRECFFIEKKEESGQIENNKNGPTNSVNEENRKDSDSGIESGSTEEMRLDSDDEIMLDENEVEKEKEEVEVEEEEEGNDDSTLKRKRKRKHNYSETPKNAIIKKELKNEKNKYQFLNLNNYQKPARNRYFSESESFCKTPKIENRQMAGREAEISNDCWLSSPIKYQSQISLGENSHFMNSPYLSDFTLGSPMFASTPLGLAFDVQSNKPILVGRTTGKRSKSEEAISKPSEYWTKVQKSGVFRSAINRIRELLRISTNSKRGGRIVRLFLSLRMPIIVTVLILFTLVSLMMVAINTLKLLFGFRSLPEYAQYIEIDTRHSFGLFGAFIETLIIIYVMVTSFVGLYSLPLLRTLRPKRKDTSMTTIIINSSLVLVASSALPVIVNTLGMTTFDLLGAYSSLEWLSSFRVVLAYNLLFLLISIAFLFNQLTSSMRREIWRRICQLRCPVKKPKNEENILIITNKKIE